ncbi:hypothetical protein H2204_003328 [Knufia peltigerae]|nr:hypothetical protein H2204_003328 [Knufia peltigerae]
MVSKTTESTAYARVEPRSSLKRQRSARLFTMTGSLLAGLVLAIVQCIFYWYLSGKTVGSTIPQAWASRVGTALAFLVKLLFATAASTAYVQRQWLALSKTSLKIRQIDSLTGILSNLLLFRDFNLWWTHPLLSCLATITWLIPLAAIIAPGSLLVTFEARHNTTNVKVPQYAFNYAAYGQYDGFDPQTGAAYLVEASIPLRRVTMSTATSGQISPMQAVFQNYTYNQQFHAPALRCFGANGTIITNLTTSLDQAFAVEEYLRFLAFTPNSALDLSAPTNITKWEDSTLYSGMDTVSEDVFRLFVVPNTNDTNSNLNQTVECNLQNASYTALFNFTNGRQSAHVSQVDMLNEVAPMTEVGGEADYLQRGGGGVSPFNSTKAGYVGVMLAFTRLLVGYGQESHYGGSTTTFSSFDMTSVNWTTMDSSIQGLEQLFQNMTLSVLSVPTLTKDETSAEEVAVDVQTFPLTYSFEPADVLIAYGLAFGFSLLSVVLGTLAVIFQGGSYQNTFSTFLRVTRGVSLNHSGPILLPQEEPDDGMDPLPRSVGDTKLRLPAAAAPSVSGRESGGGVDDAVQRVVQHSQTI